MQVDVVIEQRFYRCQQNKLWTDNAFPYIFWTRYLDVFSCVNIVARVSDVVNPKSDWKRVDGEKVNYVPLPSYIGPVGFVKSIPKLIRILRRRKQVERKVIFRVPGILSSFYSYFSLVSGQSYGAEVVGDPADVFAVGASKSMFRPFFKWLFVKMLKKQCQGAVSLSYVTEFSLQQRYPPSPSSFDTHYSSIQLEEADFKARSEYLCKLPIKIVCIGNLTQPYKGCDFMLETLAQLKLRQIDCHVSWIGGGYLQEDMQMLAKELGVESNIEFVGNLASRQLIREQLDQADLFVLTSRQEGLPRVLIEAMARSLVCIATNVGGVKELISESLIVERDNQSQLVEVIERARVLSEQQLLDIGAVNYSKAQEYKESALAKRRIAMYQHLVEAK
ncbi:glycosyltransferase [uncultured Paraglaciecola sp.]|uniref:glycosyltransferase n=1 Tax=uncultured Paraglaciecola sp. TaxID=1765024 RepID=UPI0030DD0DF7|tara:strand:- start:12275 stop:13444 length:1170 start_codon:yes stop_codon:yes gene_type:complete